MKNKDNSIGFWQPNRIVFGSGSLNQFVRDISDGDRKRMYLFTVEVVLPLLESAIESLKECGMEVFVALLDDKEPSLQTLESALFEAKSFQADVVAGIGGGSVMDMAKAVAALLESNRHVREILGKDLFAKRRTFLVCLPTTSGTGSEVSPNALFYDQEDGQKKAMISQWLTPDAAYIDPDLTLMLPPFVTAMTGFDAMIHCLEAYTNVNAHPLIDHYALQGVRLVGEFLEQAVKCGHDIEARTNLALASLYGGKCLGPVNTAAVHALAYPLANEYHVPHGLSVALLLPHVFKFNIPANVHRHAQLALALGAEKGVSELETAHNGVKKIKLLIKACGLEKVGAYDFHGMAETALSIQRLLKNNPQPMDKADIVHIYETALGGGNEHAK